MKKDSPIRQRPFIQTLAIEFGIALFAALVIFLTIALSQKNIEFVYQGF